MSARSTTAGRPPRVSRDAIVTRAGAILAADGPDALTMRRLARELDVSPMTLYHHVADKDELLVLVLEASIADVPFPAPLPDPRDRIVQYAAFVRGLLDERPWIVEVIAPGDRFAPRALAIGEVIVAALVELGLDVEAAVDGYRAIWFELLGELTYRHGRERRQREGGSAGIRERLLADIDPERMPYLHAAYRDDGPARRYDVSAVIGAFVDGLTRPRR